MNSSVGNDLTLLLSLRPRTASASLMAPPPSLAIAISAGPKMSFRQLMMDMEIWRAQPRTLFAALASQRVMTLRI